MKKKKYLTQKQELKVAELKFRYDVQSYKIQKRRKGGWWFIGKSRYDGKIIKRVI